MMSMAMVKNDLNMKQVIKDYKQGMTLRQIADKHYSNRTSVREKLIIAGVYKVEKLTDKLSKKELKNLLEKHKAIDIAKLYKVSKSTIYNLIQEYQLKEDKKHVKPKKSK